MAIIILLVATVFPSLWLGLRLGSGKRTRGAPDQAHLGIIQSAILGLLALVLGFSFSGAMSRYIDRHDALATEANAMMDAYDRASLLPNAEGVRQSLREYAALRLELFRESRNEPAGQLERRMLDCYRSAQAALYDGVRAAPQYALVCIQGLEAVQNEFTRRSALDRRHLPLELVLVLIGSSCLAMGIIGYGVGLADRRSLGSALALASLVTITLFVTIDFDRPRSGFITLDASPLENAARQMSGTPIL
jgi:hypothetical protein